jgi:hypothetical protein
VLLDTAGDVGETIGIALFGVAALAGWKYGPKVEAKITRILLLTCLGLLAVVLVIVLISLAVAG